MSCTSIIGQTLWLNYVGFYYMLKIYRKNDLILIVISPFQDRSHIRLSLSLTIKIISFFYFLELLLIGSIMKTNYLFLVLSLFAIYLIGCENEKESEYSFKTIREYFHGCIYDIKIDSKENIWFAAEMSITKFDGV